MSVSIYLTDDQKRLKTDFLHAISESSVCSFFPKVTEEEFLQTFGKNQPSEKHRTDACTSNFAAFYWGAVRDIASQSEEYARGAFLLPKSVISVLAECSTTDIMLWCQANSHSQQFVLTCPESDCLNIWDAICRDHRSEAEIQLLRFKKTMHCLSFALKQSDYGEFRARDVHPEMTEKKRGRE